MSRLAPLDKALVVILVPLYLLCFGLAAKTQIEGGGYLFAGLEVADAESCLVTAGEGVPTSAILLRR